MGIDGGGAKTAMAKQHLNDPKVRTVLHQVRGKAVAQHISTLLMNRVPGKSATVIIHSLVVRQLSFVAFVDAIQRM